MLCREASYYQWTVRRKTVWVVHCEVGSPPRSKVRGGRGVSQTGDFRCGRIKGLPQKKANGALAQARQALAGQKRAPAADFLLLFSLLLQFLRAGPLPLWLPRGFPPSPQEELTCTGLVPCRLGGATSRRWVPVPATYRGSGHPRAVMLNHSTKGETRG